MFLILFAQMSFAQVNQQELGETLWLAREAAMLSDLTPARAVAQLPQVLQHDWNAFVECGADRWFAPNAPRCLIGMRKLARLFYRGLLPKLDPAYAEVVHFNLNEEPAPRVALEDSFVRIGLPYDADPEEYRRVIDRVMRGRAVAARLKLVAAYRRELKAFKLAKLEFDPRLSIVERHRALWALSELGRETPALFTRNSELIRVGRTFRRLFERHLHLEEQVAADASTDDLRAFLREGLRDDHATELVNDTETLREEIKDLGQSLERKVHVSFDCSSKGSLTLAGCRDTLRRLDTYADRNGGLKIKALMILVGAREEMNEDFELFTPDGERDEVWAVREHFDGLRLSSFLAAQGWRR